MAISLKVDEKSAKLLHHLKSNGALKVEDDASMAKGEGSVEVKGDKKVVFKTDLRHASSYGFPLAD